MKRTTLKEVFVCDICGEEDNYMQQCTGCGIHICNACEHDNEAVSYQHAVSFSGSGDGFYCLDCDKKFKESKDNPLYNAYMHIQSLRAEHAAFYADFRNRQDEAEKHVEHLYKQNRK